mmetsp:Transcript_3493/g.8634  ORF Transcript_3493/g.8634 Transcript_3493/m.8634 type:complete len:246 (+) Transcript_3493:743-1480(+)
MGRPTLPSGLTAPQPRPHRWGRSRQAAPLRRRLAVPCGPPAPPSRHPQTLMALFSRVRRSRATSSRLMSCHHRRHHPRGSLTPGRSRLHLRTASFPALVVPLSRGGTSARWGSGCSFRGTVQARCGGWGGTRCTASHAAEWSLTLQLVRTTAASGSTDISRATWTEACLPSQVGSRCSAPMVVQLPLLWRRCPPPPRRLGPAWLYRGTQKALRRYTRPTVGQSHGLRKMTLHHRLPTRKTPHSSM